MAQLFKRDDVVAYLNVVREQLRALKKTHLIVGTIVAFCLIGGHFWSDGATKEIRDIRNSVQKFYTEFSPYMLVDIEEFKRLIERVKAELDQPINDLKEVRLASEEAKQQLEILQNYGIDKTGRVDLALYNSGGRIAGIGENTELFYSCGLFWKLFGCPGRKNSPEKVIESLMYPEECFGFKGKEGAIAIRLRKPAIVDSVTIEHIPRKMSLTGEVTSAPRNFSISAMERPGDEPSDLGNFLFEANDTSIQTFTLPSRSPFPVKYVWFTFHDNNGHPNETCVYRLRVHGIVDLN